jgi:hypothetical protein
MSTALEDREAIRELLAAYCFALDECRFEEFGALIASETACWRGVIQRFGIRPG